MRSGAPWAVLEQVSDSEVVTRILKAAFNSAKKRQAL
jgi:hypothetical protein